MTATSRPQSHHQSQGKFKHDAPRWSWRSTGVPAYTRNADAQAYVSQCRQRELDTQRKREELALELLNQGWTIFKPVKPTYNPVIAKLSAHQSIRRETVARLEERGDITANGPLAYKLVQRIEAPIPTATLLATGAARAIERAA